jgi:hypothetical protein
MPDHLNIARLGRLLACGAAGVLLTAGTMTTASAAGASPTGNFPHAKRAQYCRDFVSHLSRDLNISNERTQAAMARAARATVDDAVAKGDLTKAQGDALKRHLAEKNLCAVHSGAAAGGGGGEAR